jgi:hypothetical protein
MPPDKKNNLLSLPAFIFTLVVFSCIQILYLIYIYIFSIQGSNALINSSFTATVLLPFLILIPISSLITTLAFLNFSFNVRAGSRIAVRTGVVSIISLLLLCCILFFLACILSFPLLIRTI